MILHKLSSSDVTLVQNRFIDEYMASASGEFVKVYLYLLRCSSTQQEVSLSTIADALNHTESDIRRALSYWENKQLIRLTFDETDRLTALSFAESIPPAKESQSGLYTYASPHKSVQEQAKISIPSARKKELAGQEDIQQLLYIVETYMSRPLSSTEVTHILYFYDELHFSSDLIEYLVEYCVSKGKKNINYMRKVALDWAARDVNTVDEAKQDTNLYRKDYYTILNAFGIKNRGPARAETDYMARWFDELDFPTEIILEACKRTINSIHTPSFPYTDSILQGWKEKGVRHLSDIVKVDQAAATESRSSSRQPSARNSSNNKFNNFHQRNYDFEKLEQQLLDC